MPNRGNRGDDEKPIALVTAGARRLGKAMCLHAARSGYDVALHYNTSESAAKDTQSEIQALGRRCVLLKSDFKDFQAVRGLIDNAIKAIGKPTLLINNASLFVPNKLMSTTAEMLDNDLLVHVKAPFFLTQAFANTVSSGLVINLVDTAVLRYATDFFTYMLTKKTLLDLTKMCARELAPRIRVNAIAPGIILQPEGEDKSGFSFIATANPLHREGSPDDIVVALDYLMRNKQVTGECLFVDGGDCVDF